MKAEFIKGQFVVQKLVDSSENASYLFHVYTGKHFSTWTLDGEISTNPSDPIGADPAAAHTSEFTGFQGLVEGKLIYVWDHGFFDLVGSKSQGAPFDPQELTTALQSGDLAVKLNGQKLRGGFRLFKKTKTSQKWQFCKEDDPFATRVGSVQFTHQSTRDGTFPQSLSAISAQTLLRWEDQQQERYSTINDDQAITSMLPNSRSERNASFEKIVSDGSIKVSFAKLEKLYYSELGLTRLDLLSYYHFISPFLLRYLEDKPAIIKRYPLGIDGKPAEEVGNVRHPSWLRVASLFDETGRSRNTYPIVDNLRSLLHLVNQSGVEITSWSSRLGTPEQPDFCYISLIPNKCPVKFLVKVALKLKNVLEKVGFHPVCKTTGKGYGVDVCFGIQNDAEYKELRKFCQYLEAYFLNELGSMVSLSFKESIGRVWFMTRLNDRARGLIAPYSLRANNWAGVSAPITWQELTNKFQPQAYTFDTIFQRLREQGDLFKPVLDKKGDLNLALRMLVTHFPLQQKVAEVPSSTMKPEGPMQMQGEKKAKPA